MFIIEIDSQTVSMSNSLEKVSVHKWNDQNTSIPQTVDTCIAVTNFEICVPQYHSTFSLYFV